MGHGAGHHIEHAEHFEHAAHDQFNTKVTISIAIIAAVLAGVTIMGHKAHNLYLSHQVKAVLLENKAANKWTQFQAYNIRKQNYSAHLDEAKFTVIAPGKDKDNDDAVKSWTAKVKQYTDDEMPKTKKEAEDYDRQAEKFGQEADHLHHRADRLDLGDLGLQLGVVLASLAILTKRRSFWFIGIAAAVIGFAVAMTGQFDLFMGDHEPHGGDSVEHKSEHKKGQ